MRSALTFVIFAVIVSSACVQKETSISGGASNSNVAMPANLGKTSSVDTESVAQTEPAVSRKSMSEAVKQQTTAPMIATEKPTVTERKIVRNADLELESDSPDQAQQKITSIAETKGGFVVESRQSSSNIRVTTRDVVTMTVRVPADKFNESLEEIRKVANRVVVETVKADDVTEEFVDTEAQIKTKKALEAQFLEIMKRANTVQDALNVQSEISKVRGEIERFEGRLQYLQNQTSLSTIRLKIQTPAAFTGQSTGISYRITEAFSNGFGAAFSFVLGLLTLVVAVLPFLVLVVLPAYLVVRYFMKRNKKQS